MYDAGMMQLCQKHPNAMVAWYLMASYAYYVEDAPIISDGTFDWLSKELIKSWNTVEHQHKHLLSMDDLIAGTCLLKEYPLRVIGAVNALREYGL